MQDKQLKKNLPSNSFSLPVIPLRKGVLFPNTELVLTFGRPFSIQAIKEAAQENKLVVLVSQKQANVDEPTEDDLYQVGVLAVIERTLKTDDNLNALMRGIGRVKITNYLQFKPYLKAQVTKLQEISDGDKEEMALVSHLKRTFQQIVQMGKPVEFLNFIKLMSGSDVNEMADQISSTLNLSTAQKQQLLEAIDVKNRIKLIIKHLNHEINVLEIEKDVAYKTQEKFNKNMRESVLRERLKTIKKELGEFDEDSDLAENFQEKIKDAGFPKTVKEKVNKEINRLSSMSPNNPESGYIRTWLETMFDIPWKKSSSKKIDIKTAQKVLDKNHYGLEDVKERVLEYIAVLQLKKQQVKQKKGKGVTKQADLPTILCFVGPPGVGKTSIGRAIAEALGRKFTKISLGGIRDEAQIRGHRRTYVGAMPGRIIKGIIDAKSNNPVFILDEIDKIVQDFHGDPSAALLEALDPEQNKNFEDHYIDTPFDLSQVIFITTANTLDTIPPALRDRLEIIRYPGYTFDEKFNIAKKHLMEKVLKANGLKSNEVKFTDRAIEKIIQRYTREAGVRELERKLGKISRKLAKELVEKKTKTTAKSKKISITPKKVRDFLGPEEYDLTLADEDDQVGVATGLAWTSVGGDILFIEVALAPGKGKIHLTGKLGEVMKESAQAAFTFVKAHAKELNIDEEQFEKTDVHIHVPEGAVPKDGPSAGISVATAIASAYTNKPVKRKLAMTGEITLRGRVLRIGGLKEKVIAAHLSGVKQIIIPKENRRNLEEIPEKIKKDIKFTPVSQATEVLSLALKK
jgi:ATP-dependent Lon protease